jgi:hypothetical protein
MIGSPEVCRLDPIESRRRASVQRSAFHKGSHPIAPLEHVGGHCQFNPGQMAWDPARLWCAQHLMAGHMSPTVSRWMHQTESRDRQWLPFGVDVDESDHG